jgi:hypothetical protein
MIKSKQQLLLVSIALLATFTFQFSAEPVRAAPICSAGSCSCKGSAECNDMFSNLCSEKGGLCDTSQADEVCTCTQKASAGSKGNPTRIGVGVAKPVQTGKPVGKAQ